MLPIGKPGTPLAKRAVPVVKLAQQVCLRCSKRIGDGGEDCHKKPNVKCDYCRRLKKECVVVPAEFRKEVNQLLRLLNSRGDDEEQGEDAEDDALTLAKRSYIKDVEAFLRKEVKHGLTKRPKGDEIQLLQVQAMNRLATAAEGILDVLRFLGGIAPLGDADAPSDNEDQNPQVVPDENESEEREQEGNEEGNEETLSQEFNCFFGGGEGADPPESPTVAREKRANRRHAEGSGGAENTKKMKEKKKESAGGGAEIPGTQATVTSQEGGEVPTDPPTAATMQAPRPRVEGSGPNVEADKSKFDKRKGGMLFGKDGKPKMTLQEFLGSKGGKTSTLRLPSTIEQGKRRRVEGASSESSSPKKRRAHKDDRIQKRQEKKKARARPVVEPEEEA